MTPINHGEIIERAEARRAELEAITPKLTPLQALVAAHYQGGEFDHITSTTLAQDMGDGLFTFCINEAGDAGDKAELINMLNRAIDQLRSLVGGLCRF